MQRTLQELKTIIRDLIIEVGELKERLDRLERKQDSESRPSLPILQQPNAIEGEGYENLGRIYRDGYHICHHAFGLAREGGCLFCLALLEKE